MQVYKDFLTIFSLLKPYPKYFIGMVTSLICSSLAILAMSYGLRFFIDHGLSLTNSSQLNQSVIYLLLLVFILALATGSRVFFSSSLSENITCDLRQKIYNHLLTLPLFFFDQKKPGEVLSHLTSDISLLQSTLGSGISIGMRNIVMFLGALTMLLIYNFKLTIITFAIATIALVPVMIMIKKSKKMTKDKEEKEHLVTAISAETLYNIKLIQSYVREEYEKKKFQRLLQDNLNISLAKIRFRSLITSITMIIVLFAIVFVLWIGSLDVINNHMTAGQLSSFIFLSILSSSSLANLMEVLSNLRKSLRASERINQFLLTKSYFFNSKKSKILLNDSAIRAINFHNITFSYHTRSDDIIFKNLTLTIAGNKTTALVGKSGVGKTTIIKLLLRFYDIERGKITINDLNIKELNIYDLRSLFGYVSQDQLTFSDTIYNNILYGNLNATEEEVVNAMKLAAIFDFVSTLPKGPHTFIGERGLRLSEGQKQRISIARAFLKNPKILILDEATSSLDHLNEAQIQDAINKLMKNRTCIIIAHRLSTIKKADNIIYFDKGQIIAEGTHDNLLKHSKQYSSMYYSRSN